MGRSIFSFILLLTISSSLFGQNSSYWKKELGGSSNDKVSELVRASDGGFVMVGSNNSSDGDIQKNNGLFDIWVVKMDVKGNVQWQNTIGGASNDKAYDIIKTLDGGYAIAGSSNSFINDEDVDSVDHSKRRDFYIVKLTADGKVQWEKTWGGTSKDEAKGIAQVPDGAYVVAGYSSSSDGDVEEDHGEEDQCIFKLDQNGSLEWGKQFGGSQADIAESVAPTSDGATVIGGTSYSSDGDFQEKKNGGAICALKLGPKGKLQWKKTVGKKLPHRTEDIIRTSDGGYALAGKGFEGSISEKHSKRSSRTWFKGHAETFVMKLDKEGELQWKQTFGAIGRKKDDLGKSIFQTADKGLVIAGRAGYDRPKMEYWDYRVIKLDSTGSLRWLNVWSDRKYALAQSIIQTKSGRFILAGHYRESDLADFEHERDHDIWIWKLSEKGKMK